MRPSNILSSLIVLLLSILVSYHSTPAQGSERIVELTNGAAMPLAQTVLEVRLSEIETFAGGDFRFDFDPTLLSIDDIQLASTTASFLMAYDFPESGMLAVSLASVDGLMEMGGASLFQITLSPIQSASIGTTTPVVFHLARWYDENSIRYRLLADNSLFNVGSVLPMESPLSIEIGSETAFPNSPIEIPLLVSMGAGIGEVSGEVHLDPDALGSASFIPSSEMVGSRISLKQRDGCVAFLLTGEEECSGIDPVELGWFRFEIPSSCPIGTLVYLDLQDAEVRSSLGSPFLAHLEPGQVFVGDPPASVQNWELYEERNR